MSAIDPSDAYALGRSAAETQRLIRQAQIYGPITRRFFASAGITAGMKVLDVGSGAGDVALLLADWSVRAVPWSESKRMPPSWRQRGRGFAPLGGRT